MTCGIYLIRFNNTDKVYIGQSICIESRWVSHLSSLRLGKSPKKLQYAYNTYGICSFEILLECLQDELDSTEEEAIAIFDSYNNGFNSIPDAYNPILKGDWNGYSTETNDTYRLILKLLVQSNPTLNKRQVSEITGVSIYVIRHIAALESHAWLKEDMPVEYKQLEDLKYTKKYWYGTEYPKIVSPEGVIFTVEHVTNFAKQHGLLQPKLTEL
jgi:group I intron endonuclease